MIVDQEADLWVDLKVTSPTISPDVRDYFPVEGSALNDD